MTATRGNTATFPGQTMPGEQRKIGTYRILKTLGGGRMGIVYLAEDQEGGSQYALKLLSSSLSPTERETRRFRREFITLSRLRHPNIVEVYESGLFGDALYFVMEYVQGLTLNAHFLPAELPDETQFEARIAYLNQPQRIADLFQVTLQLCDALAWIHNRGIIHRDLKPENMMIKPSGQLKLLDFGIAKRWDKHENTQMGSIMGTFTYISPEQAQCEEIDGRSDLYSLGVILYEMLAGRPPFVSDEPIGRLYMHLNKAVPPLSEFNPQVPPALEKIVLRLLQKDPMHRYQRAEDLAEELKAVMEQLGYHTGTLPNLSLEVPELRIRDAAFVGREEERSAQARHLESLRQGIGGLILLSGHSGLGKTRLARELLASARIQQIECCSVRCHPDAPPYAVYQELMEQLRVLLSMRESDLPTRLWGDTGAYWFEMMGHVNPSDRSSHHPLESRSSSSGSSTEEEKLQLFQSCLTMLSAVVQHEPLIFFLDDLMFADESSLALTEQIVRWLTAPGAPKQLLLLATFRSEDVGADHPLSRLLLSLAPSRGYHLYDLKPLNAQEVRAMATSMLGLPPADEALAQLMKQSQGIPFFVEELLKAWEEDEQLVEAGDCWYLLANAIAEEEQGSPKDLPQTLRRRLLKRLDKLSTPAQQIAAWLAVIGQESTFDMLAELCQIPEEAFLGYLEELLQQKILLEDWSSGTENYRFSHPEIQRALYEQLDDDQRLLSHQKVAFTLKHSQATEGRFALLAQHFLKANEREQGAWYLLLAAEQQLRALAYHSAWELLEQCQSLLAEYQDDVLFAPPSSWWLRLQQARLEWLESTGRYHEGIEVAKEALKQLPSGSERGAFQRWLATFFRHIGDFKTALSYIEEALTSPDTRPELRPYILQEAGRLYRSQGKHGAALEAFREALAWAISKQLRWEEGHLCRMIGRVLHQRGELKEAKTHYSRALHLAEENKDQRGSIAALCHLGILEMDFGHLADALQHIQQARALAEEANDRKMQREALTLLGQHCLLRRQLEQAQTHFETALELALTLGDQLSEGELLGWLGVLSFEAKRPQAARLYLEDGLDKILQVGDRLVELWIRCHLAIVDLHEHARPQQDIIEELERIQRITEQLEITELLLLTRWAMGQLYRSLGRYDDALDQLTATRCLALSVGHQRILAYIERERFLLQRIQRFKTNQPTQPHP